MPGETWNFGKCTEKEKSPKIFWCPNVFAIHLPKWGLSTASAEYIGGNNIGNSTLNKQLCSPLHASLDYLYSKISLTLISNGFGRSAIQKTEILPNRTLFFSRGTFGTSRSIETRPRNIQLRSSAQSSLTRRSHYDWRQFFRRYSGGQKCRHRPDLSSKKQYVALHRRTGDFYRKIARRNFFDFIAYKIPWMIIENSKKHKKIIFDGNQKSTIFERF